MKSDVKIKSNLMKFIFLLLLIFILSCSKDEPCGEETRTEIAFENYSEFLDVKNYFTDNANFSSYYIYYPLDSISKDSSITWTMQTELRNICTSDNPKIDFFALLRKPDSSISVIGGIQEDISIVQFEPLVVSPNGLYYNSTIDYHLNGNYIGSATIIVTLSIHIKSKGSFVADRDYLFSIIDIVDSIIIAHKSN